MWIKTHSCFDFVLFEFILLLEFILLGIIWASWMCRLNCFNQIWVFSYTFFKYYFCLFPNLLFTCTHIMYMLLYLRVFYMSLRPVHFCSLFFFFLLGRLFSFDLSSIVYSANSDLLLNAACEFSFQVLHFSTPELLLGSF